MKKILYQEISPGFLGPQLFLSWGCLSKRPGVFVSLCYICGDLLHRKRNNSSRVLSGWNPHTIWAFLLAGTWSWGKLSGKTFSKISGTSEPRNKVITLTCKIKTNLILFTLPLPSFHYKLRGRKRLFSSITLAPLMKDVSGNWNIIKVVLYFFY